MKNAVQTAAVAEMFDPEIHPPPKGVTLLVVNPGGVLSKSTWYEGALAWSYLPQIPQSVKQRVSPERAMR